MLKQIASRWLLLIVVTASVSAFFLARAKDWNLELTVMVSTLATLAVAFGLERVIPHSPRWNGFGPDSRTDLVSATVLVGLVDPLLKYLSPIVIIALYRALPWDGAVELFPTQAPFAVQLLLATLLIELGRYRAHRWHHTHPYLWRLHALHHGSERLYALNNFRFHPLNYVINFAMSVFPLMLLGMPGDVLLGYLVISQPVLMLQHANIDLRSGWLNYVFSTNEVHRWHHSTKPVEANRNYGNALVVWDILFGTFKYVPDANRPKRIGLFSDSSGYPAHKGYLTQLLTAFSPSCCRA